MREVTSIELEQSAVEASGIVNVLLGLSTRRRVALLQLIGLQVHPSRRIGLHSDLMITVPWLEEGRIAVFPESSNKFTWEPLSRNESPKEGRMVGIVPDDFCIYLRINRQVSWESDEIPLGDETDCKFVGDSLRSLLLFMGLKGSVDSSWLRYLSHYPERLDEDPDALRQELSMADLS